MQINASNEKIKIGLLIPLTGEDKLLGKLLVQSTQIALEDIGSDKVEIYPRDTASNPKKTLASARAKTKEKSLFHSPQ